MNRPDRPAIRGALALLALLFAGPARGDVLDDPPAPPRDAGPVYLFLNAPDDLDAFLKGLARPDFTLRKGGDPGAAEKKADEPPAPVVEAVAVSGEARDDLAELAVGFVIHVAGPGPQWAPIRLDGLTVGGVTEGDRERAHQVGKDGGWQVELDGEGEHRIEVSLLAQVRGSGEARRLELPIPEAASTRIDLAVRGRATDAQAGAREPIGSGAIGEGARTRLRASLAPRRRLDLSWRIPAETGDEGPPLLAATGAIEVDVERGALRVRSSWSLRSDRGTAGKLNLRLDRADELVGVELDSQPVTPEAPTTDVRGDLAIPLPDPIKPGAPRRLVVTTRRPLPAGSATVEMKGLPLLGFGAQSGVVAIARSGDLWVRGTPGRGVRQIDPRADLPLDLRARPGTVLAYQFFEQPFELALRVDPSPPWVRVESRSLATVEADRARVETWLDYQVGRGRIFDVQVRLPRGLELESVEPVTVVEASHERPEAGGAFAEDGRVLTLRLTPRARDDVAFRVRLVGRQAIDPGRAVSLALFQPLNATSRGGKLAIAAARDVVADLAADGSGGAFATAAPEALADWPRPPERAATAGVPLLWLRHEGSPAALPLTLAVFPRSIRHQTTVQAQLDRRRLEARQETVCQVRHGVLSALDVAVPEALEGRWDVEGDEVSRREWRGPAGGGGRRYRLTLGRETTDTVTLRFRYRLPLDPGLAPGAPARLEVPWIRPLDGTPAATRVEVSADPSIRLSAEAGGAFSAGSEEDPSATPGASGRLLLVGRADGGAGPAVVLARALAEAPLPPMVASRLWLRTVQGPDGDLRVSAWYRVESPVPALDVAVPVGAEWIGAWVGGDPAPGLESLPDGTGHRVKLPTSAGVGPRPVRLEYRVSARAGASGWDAPRLLGGGVVQQALWEIRVPRSRALVGIPSGWTDENEWYWDVYVWKRRPVRDATALLAWVGGPSARADGPIDPGGPGDHGYLFGRPGEPPRSRPTIAPRALLVGLFSGLVLLVGVPILVLRPPGRLVVLAGLVAALLLAVAVESSVTFLGLQSAAVGVLLLAVAAATQGLVDRRWGTHRLRLGPSGLAAPAAAGSSLRVAAAVGSEESTVIRPRVPSTVDRHPPAQAPDPEGVPADSPALAE